MHDLYQPGQGRYRQAITRTEWWRLAIGLLMVFSYGAILWLLLF